MRRAGRRLPGPGATQTIRVVAYNIEADVNGDTAPNNGLSTVLAAIGENYVNGAVHPLGANASAW